MKVGIIANTAKEGARSAIDRLTGVLSVRGIATSMEREAAAFCRLPGGWTVRIWRQAAM